MHALCWGGRRFCEHAGLFCKRVKPCFKQFRRHPFEQSFISGWEWGALLHWQREPDIGAAPIIHPMCELMPVSVLCVLLVRSRHRTDHSRSGRDPAVTVPPLEIEWPRGCLHDTYGVRLICYSPLCFEDYSVDLQLGSSRRTASPHVSDFRQINGVNRPRRGTWAGTLRSPYHSSTHEGDMGWGSFCL